MKHIIILSLLSLFAFNSQAKRFDIEFINSQSNICVVYLDNSFIGKMEKGEIFNTKLKKGIHKLSFVVFQPNGEYYTYLRDLEVNESHQFLLLANDSGYIHLEKYEGVNPLVLQSIQHLPVFTANNFNLLLLKLDNIEFENSRFELVKKEIVKHQFTTQELAELMSYLSSNNLKIEVAQIAYQHLLDKHNYHLILFNIDETTVKKLEQNAKNVNRFL